jgi:hypothetical protein
VPYSYHELMTFWTAAKRAGNMPCLQSHAALSIRTVAM